MRCARLAFAPLNRLPTNSLPVILSASAPMATSPDGVTVGHGCILMACPLACFDIIGWACGRSGVRGAFLARCHQPIGARSWLKPRDLWRCAGKADPANCYLARKGLDIVPCQGTLWGMADTPLKIYLAAMGKSAEEFASDNGLSAWSVRHWVRGDKEPSLKSQVDLDRATSGKVTPAKWLSWRLAKASPSNAAA